MHIDRTILNRGLTVPALAVGLLLGACSPEPATETPDAAAATAEVMPATAPTLESASALGVENVALPVPHVLTSAQPTPEQLDGLAAAGFEHFISLRLPDENGAGWEEEHTAATEVDFKRLPIAGADGLTRENVEALAELMDAAGDEPTVLYCGSSNRVGALLALKAYWLDGATEEEALALGQSAGMTRLEGPVRELMTQEP